jgi:predicted phosphate transport protein (TIGR00153 family)
MALSSKVTNPFGRTKALEVDIDVFINKLSESTLLFKHAINLYLIEGHSEQFDQQQKHLNEFESQADDLRRNIEIQLYSEMLIPDARGDVLALLENLDAVHGILQGTLWSFAIENPDIPEEYRAGFVELTDMVVLAVEALVRASRAFFRTIENVTDHIHKVGFYETEADKVSTLLKTAIFASDLTLDRKMHLRSFIEQIDEVADIAEDVSDSLTIFTIKRSL